jgi:hypothetical protein
VVSRGKASWAELTTVLGIEDLYALLELIIVDDHNLEVLRRKAEKG